MVPPKAHLALLLSLLLGIVLHVAYLPSALDFYFDSHLVSGMPTHSVSSVAPTAEQSGEPLAPPAKRAVLFLVDGLRADALFERPARAPFIQSILRNTGAWGVSHVDAPTETRPKSISVLSGMQEDLSAIRTAWKSNPVPFDSLLNESQKAWAYGSPDVIPIFTEYLTSPSSVHSETYTLEFQETMHPNDLDQFVVDKVQGLFAQAGADKQSQLYKDLMQGRIVFLFHLLGTDSQGHANGGFSPAYLGHVSQVDQRVKHIVQTMDAFYQDDGKTTFALTSDHGMLRERHHDDPQIEVRRSPFVAWGAGIRGPLHDPGVGHDAFSQDWEYHDLARDDVRQVDISSLLASLIDIPIPLNSVGRVPLSYMSTSLAYKAHAMYANALQVWSQYRVKEAQVARQSLLFWPFRPAIDAEALFGLRASLQEEKYQDVVASSRIAVDEYLKGLQYYHTYHKNFWRLVISAGYVGWMVFILGQLSRMRNDSSELPGITSNKTAPNSVSVAVWNTAICICLARLEHASEFTPARIAQLNRVLLAVAVVVPLLSARAKETSTVSYMFTMSMGAMPYFIMLTVAFFGTEDLASLSPFKMPAAWSVVVRPNTTQRAILIVVRLVLPIVLLSCAAVSVGRSMFTRNPLALFCTAMAVADYITVRLFWSIITHGAWLTMGSSLVRYVIAGSIMPLLCLFFVLGSALLGLNSSPVRTRRSAP
ncbi:Glycosyl phosphatidyl inositol anchor synthesis [Sorochytrium milnesiophthora]